MKLLKHATIRYQAYTAAPVVSKVFALINLSELLRYNILFPKFELHILNLCMDL